MDSSTVNGKLFLPWMAQDLQVGVCECVLGDFLFSSLPRTDRCAVSCKGSQNIFHAPPLDLPCFQSSIISQQKKEYRYEQPKQKVIE